MNKFNGSEFNADSSCTDAADGAHSRWGVEFWSNGTTTLYLSQSTPSSGHCSTHFDTNQTENNHLRKLETQSRKGAGQENNNEPPSNRTRIVHSILAGSVAGMTSTLCCHPLDVLRTKIQSMAFSAHPQLVASTSSFAATATAATSSPFQVLAQTIQHGGYRSLYTGMSLPLAAQALYKATIFGVNETSRAALIEYRTQERQKTGFFELPTKLSLLDTYICGALGGMVTAFVWVTPVELVRNQLIAQHSKLAKTASTRTEVMQGASLSSKYMKGPVDVIRQVLHSQGVSGLWRGAGVTVARDGLGCGLFFVNFELGKRYIPRIVGQHEYTSLITMIGAGSFAGLGFWLLALPLDTVKTLVQTDSVPSAASILRQVYYRDGFWGLLSLYKGWQVAFGRGAPSAVITLGTFELCSNFLQRH